MPPDAKPPTQREYWNGRVGEEWAAQADRMDAMLSPLSTAALDALALQRGERVLDIGCGAGATTIEIAQRIGADGCAVGVDISHPLVELGAARAKAKGLAITLIEADASADALPGAPFDAAFSRFGVMFFSDPVGAFAHIRGALRAGGRLTFACWRPMPENGWALTPIQAVMPMLKAPLQPPDPDAPGPFAFADPAKITRILEAAGWKDIAIKPWDGALMVAGGGSVDEAAQFMLKIGPCARAIADQELDRAEALRRLGDRLAADKGPAGVALPAACWIVGARA